MPIHIIRNDITKMKVDAIVNAANRFLKGGSGVNGAIHKAAGPGLLKETLSLGGCETGEAKISGAYDLPCKYVIHTVGPVWQGGNNNEPRLLANCYINSLDLAVRYGCKTIAFPLISSGVFGYPKSKALKVAMQSISDYLLNLYDDDITVYLVLFTKDCFDIGSKLFSGIKQYIDDHYVEAHYNLRHEQARIANIHIRDEISESAVDHPAVVKATGSILVSTPPAVSLEKALECLDETFSQMVLRKIKEKGLKNSECYKKANIDKKLFSKINNDITYKPKKQTALALAIALELSLDETKELLMKAGLALSHSDKFDIIIEYFIKQQIYDIHQINEVLFYYDQLLLGSSMN